MVSFTFLLVVLGILRGVWPHPLACTCRLALFPAHALLHAVPQHLIGRNEHNADDEGHGKGADEALPYARLTVLLWRVNWKWRRQKDLWCFYEVGVLDFLPKFIQTTDISNWQWYWMHSPAHLQCIYSPPGGPQAPNVASEWFSYIYGYHCHRTMISFKGEWNQLQICTFCIFR